MKATFFLAATFAALIAAGPVQRACTDERCPAGAGACRAGYGNCLHDCKASSAGISPSTKSLCSTTPTTKSLVIHSTVIADLTVAPATTPAAGLARVAKSKSDSCKHLTECVDKYVYCGGVMTRYGGCYDTCTPSLSPTAPTCPYVPVTTTSKTSASTLPSSEQPKQTEKCNPDTDMFCPTW